MPCFRTYSHSWYDENHKCGIFIIYNTHILTMQSFHLDSFRENYFVPQELIWAAGGLVVKTLSCCTGCPRFDSLVENPKFSTDLHQQNPRWMSFRWDIKLAVTCISVYAGQWANKRSHIWGQCVTCCWLLMSFFSSAGKQDNSEMAIIQIHYILHALKVLAS